MKMKIFFICAFFTSSFFILNAQPLGQFPMNVMTVDELPQNVHSKLGIGANVGGVYRFAKAQPSNNQQVTDFFNRLRWGVTFNANLTYFFSENYGAGVVYSFARHSHKINDYRHKPFPYFNPDVERKGVLEDRIIMQFIGPAFQYRYYTNFREDAFVTHIALGYIDYRDNFFYPRWTDSETSPTPTLGGREKAISGAFGIHAGIGYDYALSETWALGVQLAVLIGTRSNERRTTESGQVANINLVNSNQVDNLARVELTVGLRFNQ